VPIVDAPRDPTNLSGALARAIIVCRNEIVSIERCLNSVLSADAPPGGIEILVVDGESSDGTRAVLDAYERRHAPVRIVNNPKRTTPHGLNRGIKASNGRTVFILGAHSVYPRNYFTELLDALQSLNADVVGGVLKTVPASTGYLAGAIATAMSHPLGVGNATFRTGVTRVQPADTVAFGCYRRVVFDQLGLFDEELARNQDDEFSLRIVRRGGRIFVVPGVEIEYVARDSLVKLARMYYQYGRFKPLVARKVGGILTVRQVAPSAFLLTLIVLVSLCPFFTSARVALVLVVASYGLALMTGVFTALIGRRSGSWALPLAFAAMHVSYGAGYLVGALGLLFPHGGKRASDPALTR
jgi:glycosyltransferase involved in cell wall biosynthesis